MRDRDYHEGLQNFVAHLRAQYKLYCMRRQCMSQCSRMLPHRFLVTHYTLHYGVGSVSAVIVAYAWYTHIGAEIKSGAQECARNDQEIARLASWLVTEPESFDRMIASLRCTCLSYCWISEAVWQNTSRSQLWHRQQWCSKNTEPANRESGDDCKSVPAWVLQWSASNHDIMIVNIWHTRVLWSAMTVACLHEEC